MSTTTTETWTPARLIEVFCREELRSSFAADAKREHSTWHAGFCSYAGRDSYGPGVDGFDDGYDLWNAICVGEGWQAISEAGDWPYLMFFAWNRGTYAIAHYCEGDFGVETFENPYAWQAAVKRLIADHPAP